MFLLHYCIFTGGMLLRVGNFFSGSFFFPAFSPILLPPIIFLSTVVFRLLFSCFTRSSLPLSTLLLPHRFFIFLFCFFCLFLLPIVLCASFLYVLRPSFIHLSNPPVFSGPSMLCRILSTGGSFLSLVPSVSFLPALHFSFPLFNAFLSAPLSSFLFVPLPVN